MRLFRRTARPSKTVPVDPEFGVQVTLRRGDKIVRRDARGAIRVTRVTEECVELADLGQMAAPPPRPRRRG
ncbi:MAG TPA: hypothetical protein VN646_07350 [Candidatus Acidoferrum sp.]|jgi:hypothetical protein|nr:hypothetical protein [Candidatus Acidoferrum sp.]